MSNKLKLFRSLEKFLKNNERLASKYKTYENLIAQIDDLFNSLIISKFGGGTLGGASLSDITSVVEQGIGLITSARDFREKKIQSLTALLKELKLEKISVLTGDSKPKDN